MSDHKNRSSGKSPTRFMERPGTQPDEEKDLFQDQSGDEGVNSRHHELNPGQEPQDQRGAGGRPAPDKDWYRKWQDGLARKDNRLPHE